MYPCQFYRSAASVPAGFGHERAHNDLGFPALYSLSPSWHLHAYKSLTIIHFYILFETIQSFMYTLLYY
jgi:hypothetical protein